MSNAKAHAFNAQMGTDSRVRELEQQLAAANETIEALRARVVELEDTAANVVAAAAKEPAGDAA
jgi:uncharacterized coiled-coil protein SlyX